jgi:hypothetical protein
MICNNYVRRGIDPFYISFANTKIIPIGMGK